MVHKLHSDDKYCNDYGAGSSGDYYDLDSCVQFAKKEGASYFHYNSDYSECYVCASQIFNDSSAGTKVYKFVEAGAGEEVTFKEENGLCTIKSDPSNTEPGEVSLGYFTQQECEQQCIDYSGGDCSGYLRSDSSGSCYVYIEQKDLMGDGINTDYKCNVK